MTQDQKISTVALFRDPCTLGISVEVSSRREIKTLGSLMFNVDIPKTMRVELRGEPDILKAIDVSNPFFTITPMGLKAIWMWPTVTGDTIRATYVIAAGASDDKFIRENNIRNLDTQFSYEEFNYNCVNVGLNIVITRTKREKKYETMIEKFDVKESLTVKSFCGAFAFTPDNMFELIDMESYQKIGLIYKCYKKAVITAKDGALNPSFQLRTLRDFFYPEVYERYIFDFGNDYGYFIDPEILYDSSYNDMKLVEEPENVAVQINSDSSESILNDSCNVEMSDCDDKYTEYARVKGTELVNIQYNSLVRYNYMNDFFQSNVDNYLSDLNGSYSTKLFEFFFNKHLFTTQKRDNEGNVHHRMDYLVFNAETDRHGYMYSNDYSSVIPYRLGFVLYDVHGYEIKNVLATPLMAVDSVVEKINKKTLRKFSFVCSLSDFTTEALLTPDEYKQMHYVTVLFLFDDNYSSNAYKFTITNLREGSDTVVNVGLKNICSVSLDQRFLIGEKWVSWLGNTIRSGISLHDFIVRRGLIDLATYRRMIRNVSSFVHMCLIRGWDTIGKYRCAIVIDPLIIKKFIINGNTIFKTLIYALGQYSTGDGFVYVKDE